LFRLPLAPDPNEALSAARSRLLNCRCPVDLFLTLNGYAIPSNRIPNIRRASRSRVRVCSEFPLRLSEAIESKEKIPYNMVSVTARRDSYSFREWESDPYTDIKFDQTAGAIPVPAFPCIADGAKHLCCFQNTRVTRTSRCRPGQK